MILAGTNGYRHRDWVGPFYPSGMPEERFLSHYAACFSLLELNASVTFPKTPAETETLLRLAGDGLHFTAFLHPLPGHDPRTLPDLDHLRRLRLGLDPLVRAGRLLAAVLPLHPAIEDTLSARDMLRRAVEGWSVPLLVEARHPSWWMPLGRGFLREERIGLCAFDGPDPPTPAEPDPRLAALGDAVCVRFHGRGGRASWATGGAARRDYLYSWDELVEWLPVLRALEMRTPLVLVILNNPWGARAVINARMIGRLVS